MQVKVVTKSWDVPKHQHLQTWDFGNWLNLLSVQQDCLHRYELICNKMDPWVLRIIADLRIRVFVGELSVGGGQNCCAYCLCILFVNVCAHCCCCLRMFVVEWCHLSGMKTRTMSMEERRVIVRM